MRHSNNEMTRTTGIIQKERYATTEQGGSQYPVPVEDVGRARLRTVECLRVENDCLRC